MRKTRIASIIVSIITICIALGFSLSTINSKDISYTIYLFRIDTEKTFSRFIPTITTTPNQPLVNLAWKIQPSSSPLPSPTAPSHFSFPTPVLIQKLNMSIAALVTTGTTTITITLTDENNFPVANATGTIAINGVSQELPSTDSNGKSSKQLSVKPGDSIVISESANGMTVTGNIVAS